MAIISIPTSIGGVSIPGSAGQVLSGPLAALFGGKGVTTISYPQELATDATKSHYVQFSVKEIIPQSYEKILNRSIDYVKEGAAATVELGKSVVTDPSGSAEQSAAAVSSTISNAFKALSNNPIEILTGGVSAGIKIGAGLAESGENFIRQSVKPQTTESKAVISLYMPDTLESSYNANYSEISLAAELGTIQSIRQIAQIATTFGEGAARGGARGAFGAASSDPNVISTAIGGVIGAIEGFGGRVGENLKDVLLQGQGYASNPQLQMLYQGTNFRNFSLAFTFTPKSQAEAQIVNNIIYQFKYYAAPALAQGKTSSSETMFLIPPAIFNVKFFFKGIDNKYLPKYADCVLKNIDVNYAPNGFAAHIDGAPVQTQLTLQFEEIEIVDKARLSKGYHSNADDKDALR
jgi:hypothetical protein